MGRNTVERDGISVSHAARLVLVGRMNPEEGELRPQLLDRFGLTVEVAAPRDPARRSEVVRSRLAFDAHPVAFGHRFAGEQETLRQRIAAARAHLRRVALPDGMLTKIAKVCAAFEVDGMRADLVTARAAVAHAAWEGRDRVTRADVRAAARLALPHRRRRNPFDAPGIDEDLLDQILGSDEPEPDPDNPDPNDPDPDPSDSIESTTSATREDARDALSIEEPRADGADRDPAAREGQPEDPAPREGEGEDPDSAQRHTASAVGTASAREPFRARLLTAKGTGRAAHGARDAPP